jgi:hypothetical protein
MIIFVLINLHYSLHSLTEKCSVVHLNVVINAVIDYCWICGLYRSYTTVKMCEVSLCCIYMAICFHSVLILFDNTVAWPQEVNVILINCL